MENFDLQQVIAAVKDLSWPAAAVVVFIVSYKAGILGAIASWVKKPIGEAAGNFQAQIDELQGFRETAESNHFHDLEDLKQDRREVWNRINALDKSFQDFRVEMSGRISRLEARIFNGNGKH